MEGGEGETLETRFRGIFARLTQRGVCALIVRVRQFRFFTLFPPYFWERVGCPKSLDFEPVAKNPLPFPFLSPTLPTTHKQKIFPPPRASLVKRGVCVGLRGERNFLDLFRSLCAFLDSIKRGEENGRKGAEKEEMSTCQSCPRPLSPFLGRPERRWPQGSFS